MVTNTSTAPRFRLSGPARKAFLLVHIVSAALWFGIDIALGILAVTALLTDDPATASTAMQAIRMFAIWPMFGASLASLATGVVLGLGSKYGLLRYWWVAIKLAANLLMSALIVTSLRPGLDLAASTGPTTEILYPVSVAPTLLLTAFVLSVWKPRARLRRAAPPPAQVRQPAAVH
ncbi:MAG TPA: hypothetical protein VIL37_02870 [Natronosporangium sp.]